jgi:hypothetical protein
LTQSVTRDCTCEVRALAWAEVILPLLSRLLIWLSTAVVTALTTALALTLGL